MAKKEVTVKRFKRGKHFYIGVWVKGKRGIFTSTRVRKGVTIKKVRAEHEESQAIKEFIKDVEKVEKKVFDLWRITQAKIYDQPNYRAGQIRVWVITRNKGKYPSKRLNNIIDILQLRFNVFKRTSITTTAREVRKIEEDEIFPLDVTFVQSFKKRSLVHKRVEQLKDVIFYQIIGGTFKGRRINITGIF